MCCWNVATYDVKYYNGKIEIIISFSTTPQCQHLGVDQGITQTELSEYMSFIESFLGYMRPSYIYRNVKLNNRANRFWFFFFAFLKWKEKQIGEKNSAVSTHRITDCLLKNTFNKINEYIVYTTLTFFYQRNMFTLLIQDMCVFSGYLLWNKVELILLVCLLV